MPNEQAQRWRVNDAEFEEIVNFASKIGPPGVGSPILGDDSKISGLCGYPFGVSHAFGQTFALGVDHLSAAQSVDVSPTYPTGYAGLLATLRAALLAFSHSLWIVDPASREKRVSRASWYHYGNLFQAKQMVTDLRDQADWADYAAQLDALNKVVRPYGKVFAKKADGLCVLRHTDTEIVDEAGGIAFNHGLEAKNEEFVRDAARWAWRMASSAAHARPSILYFKQYRSNDPSVSQSIKIDADYGIINQLTMSSAIFAKLAMADYSRKAAPRH